MSVVPQRQSGPSVAPSLPSEPLCVADIVPELLPLLGTVSRDGDGCPLRNSAQSSGESPILPVPPTVADDHRVQVSIRGRRYEMTVALALTHCLSLFVFFCWPFGAGDEDGGAAKRRPQTVGDVIVAHTAAGEVMEERHLLSHYTRVVEPVLHVFLDHWAAPQGAAATPQAERERAETVKTEEAGHPASLPRPTRISYDASTRVWRLEYAARITAAEEDAVRAQCQCGESAAAAVDALCSSPFRLLQSEYMGVLLVYLRRCAKVRKERQEAAVRGDELSAPAPYPSLPIRWAEMSYDQQVSFVQLIRCLGVVSLARTYTCPTAPLSTSLYIGADAADLPVPKAGSCSPHAPVASRTRVLPQEPQRAATGATRAVADAAERCGGKERCVDEDGDEGLMVPIKGCARCGTAGHAAEECRY
ncbi:hypothetical protein LSCM1_07645 [Leishmania martiniquensis]|uniref:CCHC-type domain-containing protein n=1 Tax=Leishmania martiniquensis TaxID=1580590 RepID=A0A836KTY8_9TRYP|nr:hypothetical protein LSCM1_07645 [Leishmania martiniquensis]